MENDHIRIGRFVDETTFKRRKRLTLPGICSIDFIHGDDTIEVHEVKKGKRFSDAHRYQVLYYLEVISLITGLPSRGFIHNAP